MDESLIIAISAIFISVFSVIVGALSLYFNRIHNKKSVKPIVFIPVWDYEDYLLINIKNVGLGPLIIKSTSVINKEGEIKKDVIDWMPKLPKNIYWTGFNETLDNRPMEPGEGITLLRYDVDEKNSKSTKFRDEIRKRLKELRIIIDYTDIYDSKFKPHKKDLSWFGRLL